MAGRRRLAVPSLAASRHVPLRSRRSRKPPSAPSRWPRGCGRASLDEFVGQQHFLGEGKLLRRLIKADRLTARHLLRPAGHRQDDAGPPAGARDAGPVPATQRRHQRREGTARRARRSPRRPRGRRRRERCCSSTRSTASTRPSKTPCCPTWKRAPSSSSARRRRIRSSRSTTRWSAARASSSSSRSASTT